MVERDTTADCLSRLLSETHLWCISMQDEQLDRETVRHKVFTTSTETAS